jgi:hypothetical protein
VTGVKADNLGQVWSQVKPLLSKALAPRETIDRVLTDIYTKQKQLWISIEGPMIEAALTTEIVTEGDRKICNIAHVGGTGLNNWLPYFDLLDTWARAEGCSIIRVAHGRPGWQRILNDFKVTRVTLEKEL